MVAVQQQVARDLRLRKGEKRQDKELSVPEDVSPVAEATERFCANTDILVVTRRGDEELEQHIACGDLGLVIPDNLHIRVCPVGDPGLGVCPQKPIICRPLHPHLGELRQSRGPCVSADIVRGKKCDHLLHRDRLPPLDLQAGNERWHVLLLMHFVFDVGSTVHLQPGRFAEHDARGACRTLQEDRLLVSLTLFHLIPVL